MPGIPERELVHLSGSGKTPWKRAEAVSEKIFHSSNSREAYVTTPGQRVNLLPLALFDNLYRPRVLVHNILKGKHNPIIQGRFRLLRKTTHEDFHRFHLIKPSRSIANTHVREARRDTTLRHYSTSNLFRSLLELEGI